MTRQRTPAGDDRPATTAGRPLSHAERGRLGGLATAGRHGPGHMRAIGARGGRATVAAHGAAHMAALGRAGFAVTAERYFEGDRERMLAWLQSAALQAIDPLPANGVWQQWRCWRCEQAYSNELDACPACGAAATPF